MFLFVTGFLSWDKDTCHVDLEKELQAFVAQAPEGEEARNGKFFMEMNLFSFKCEYLKIVIVYKFNCLMLF